MRRLTNASLVQIGDKLGQHHTTVLYGQQLIEHRLPSDAALQVTVDALIAELNAIRAA
jgi:chromosomal replication initiation ATPase DnaA